MSFKPRKPKGAWWLLNHVPFDGCMLVFNANPRAWRTSASMLGAKLGFRFHVSNIKGGTRQESESRTFKSDLYVTLDSEPRQKVFKAPFK